MDVFGTYGVKIPMRLENDQLTNVDDIIKFNNEPEPEIYDTLDSPEAKAIYNKEGYRVLTLKRTLSRTAISKWDNGLTAVNCCQAASIIIEDLNLQKKFHTVYFTTTVISLLQIMSANFASAVPILNRMTPDPVGNPDEAF